MSTHTATANGLTFAYRLSEQEVHPFDVVTWEVRDAVIQDNQGNTVFSQKNIRAPQQWSQTATNIVASKYFHGSLGSENRESGVDVLIERVVTAIVVWGTSAGYFQRASDAEIYGRELTALLIGQYAAFNSPVWFNVGCDRLEPNSKAKSWHWEETSAEVVEDAAGYRKPQCSACFINSVEDSMESILTLAKTEGMLFKWGSGTGTNFSPIRGSMETLSGGGTASGPLSFMRGYDAFAGVIKSGGKTRRAAKMAILDVDHPDIEEFITCKSREEAKAKALVTAGYDGAGPDSEAYASVFYQNANNSVRVTDAFMQMVEEKKGESWPLVARSTGEAVKTVDPTALFRQIAEETWRCGDPGLQFDTTINSWHTCPESGRINASNPCSEYMFLDNSACNLASLNLVKFVRDGVFDTELFAHAVRVLIVAQDILVDHAGYPTEQIAIHSHDYRPLGLGYANLGAMLMGMGLPYDSDEGREMAAAVTALMGGAAYKASAEIAATMEPLAPADSTLGRGHGGTFPGYHRNRTAFLEVIAKHRAAAQALYDSGSRLPAELWRAALDVWEEADELGRVSGFRNAQVTVLAPTGTIGFMMDCDTTGIEPMLGVVVFKKMVGGGYLTLVNQAVGTALLRLGYTTEAVSAIEGHIQTHSTIEGTPALREEHLAIFDCAFRPAKGSRSIHWRGHVRMMAAVQPFLSGAISKTINLPAEATVADIESAYLEAWRLGLKAVAIYRDGSKSSQPVSAKADSKQVVGKEPVADLSGAPRAVRHRLPEERMAVTHHFGIAGHEGYITVGLYPNGQPGEIFIRMAKEGSTIAGLMECFGAAVSVGLQHGVPIKVLCDKFSHTRFEPSGWTGNQNLGYAKSIMDYIFRWIDLRFLSGAQLPLFTAIESTVEHAGEVQTAGSNLVPPASGNSQVSAAMRSTYEMGDAPLCLTCGSLMVRNGSCYKCIECGGTSGCS